MLIIGIYFIILTLDAFYQKFLLNWKQSQTIKTTTQYSNEWHAVYALIFTCHVLLALFIIPNIMIKEPITIFCFILWMRWVWFEGLFNLLRGLNWFYIGSGNIDIFIKKLSKKIHFPSEFVLLLMKLITLLIISIINHYEINYKIY